MWSKPTRKWLEGCCRPINLAVISSPRVKGDCGRFRLRMLLIQVLIRMEPTEFEDRPATTAMLEGISD